MPSAFEFDTASRAEVIDALMSTLTAHYVFPDKAAEYTEYLLTRREAGAYDTLAKPQEFCHALTVDLQQASRDRHLVILWRPEERTLGTSSGAEDVDVEEQAKQRERQERRERQQAAEGNHGFRKVEILSGNIGLITLSGFGDPQYGGDTAVAAMRFVSNTNGLIFDVRGNMGGDGRMVILLCSYLCPGNQWDLSGYYSRKVGRLEPSWTMPYVPGPYYEKKPVYVLTGPLTFSAGELLAYDLQALKRATVVGEVTGGAAHGAEFHPLPYGCDALISFSAPTNPLTGGNWEAVGVQPDIAVPEAQAMGLAHRHALKAVLAMRQSISLSDALQTEMEVTVERLERA
ncbi:MAG: S41 family peptidase [Armatimonadota bacterium]